LLTLPTKKATAAWAAWEWECNLISDFRFWILDFGFSKQKGFASFERSLFLSPKFNVKCFRRAEFCDIICLMRGNKNMATLVLEGTWEEIVKHAPEFSGRRLRVTVLSEEEKTQPNQKMAEIMKRVKELQKDMRFTDGSKTQEMLRAARDGGMFGGELDE
jgi:hypothetical protein